MLRYLQSLKTAVVSEAQFIRRAFSKNPAFMLLAAWTGALAGVWLGLRQAEIYIRYSSFFAVQDGIAERFPECMTMGFRQNNGKGGLYVGCPPEIQEAAKAFGDGEQARIINDNKCVTPISVLIGTSFGILAGLHGGACVVHRVQPDAPAPAPIPPHVKNR